MTPDETRQFMRFLRESFPDQPTTTTAEPPNRITLQHRMRSEWIKMAAWNMRYTAGRWGQG